MIQANDLLAAGIQLMLTGMGTVFGFLALLILATTAMSALVLRFQPVPAAVDDATAAQPTPTELAAISAAIHRHRSS